MSKILIFALHVKDDRKPTIVNKITQNLFLQQPKDIDYQIPKEKILTLIKDIRNKHNATYWCKPKLLSYQPIRIISPTNFKELSNMLLPVYCKRTTDQF